MNSDHCDQAKSRRYLLSDSVFYERYGEQVYVRSVRTQREYLFNEITWSLLNCFSKTQPVTAGSALRRLQSEYETEGEEEFAEEILSFLEELAEEEILTAVPVSEESGEKALSLYGEVQEFCAGHGILQELILELTYRCNEKCIHCYVDGPEPDSAELTVEDYRKLLREVRDAGCLNLLLTGGEVSVKPGWIEIAEYAASIGMLVDIYSNGLSITDAEFDRIRALHPNSLSYSLYGSTAEIHDAVTRVPGSFDRTLKRIMMTRCAGIDTYIKTVVIRENAGDLEALFRLGQRIGVKVKPALTIFDTYAGISRGAHILDTVEEYERVLQLCQRYSPDVVGGGRDPDGPACKAGQCSLTVDPYGNVYACMSVREPLGNIRERGILDIWRQPEPLNRIRRVRFSDLCRRCHSCRYAGFCNICMGRIDPLTGALPPDICMIAEASWRIAGGEEVRE